MNRPIGAIVMASILALATPAFAQAPQSSSPKPPAVTTSTAPVKTSAAPVEGKNSFTEGQARKRIEDRGYSAVSELKKDDKSVWRGKAMKDGQSVGVALDYQGNVVAQ